MGLFKRRRNNLVYSEKDMERYEEWISLWAGKFDSIFHEISSPDLHIDIIVVPPSEEYDYYTLVTMGMGAYPMPVPPLYKKANRAEIAIRLPRDWEITSGEEKWYWPIRMLKTLARMPYYEKSWLGVYHDIDFGAPVSEETELCSVLLDYFDNRMGPLTLENGDQLILYNAIPLYRSEMEYKEAENAKALLGKMSRETLHGPVDVHRDKVI